MRVKFIRDIIYGASAVFSKRSVELGLIGLSIDDFVQNLCQKRGF